MSRSWPPPASPQQRPGSRGDGRVSVAACWLQQRHVRKIYQRCVVNNRTSTPVFVLSTNIGCKRWYSTYYQLGKYVPSPQKRLPWPHATLLTRLMGCTCVMSVWGRWCVVWSAHAVRCTVSTDCKYQRTTLSTNVAGEVPTNVGTVQLRALLWDRERYMYWSHST